MSPSSVSVTASLVSLLLAAAVAVLGPLATPSVAAVSATVTGNVQWQLNREDADAPGGPGFTLALCTRACVRDIQSVTGFWWDESAVAGLPASVNPGDGSAYTMNVPEGAYLPAMRFNTGYDGGWYGGYLKAAGDGTWRLTSDPASATPVTVSGVTQLDFTVVIPYTPPTDPDDDGPSDPDNGKPRIKTGVLTYYIRYNDAYYGGWRFEIRKARPDVKVRIQAIGCGGKVVAAKKVTRLKGTHSVYLAPSPKRLGPEPKLRFTLTQPGHADTHFSLKPKLNYWKADRSKFRCRS